MDDPRLSEMQKRLKAHKDNKLTLEEFAECIDPAIGIVERALQGRMVIADFKDFSSDIREIYEKTKKVTSGNVATYIPQLARVDPELYGVSICTVDGQQMNLGDTNTLFCV